MQKRKSKEKQYKFTFVQHGGVREGAGAKKRLENEPKHVARPILNPREPIAITMKLNQGFGNLRNAAIARDAAKAFAKAETFGLRVTQFSLQTNHIHLMAEADSNEALELGMRSIAVCLAKAIQRLSQRMGGVFRERFHAHILKTPTEVKNALNYILFNWAKHLGTARCVDPFSSVYLFEKLETLIGAAEARRLRVDLQSEPRWMQEFRAALARPLTWLLGVGWERAIRR